MLVASPKQGKAAHTQLVSLVASCAYRTAVGSDVVVTMCPNALLFVRRGYAEPAPQARRAPRFQFARGLAGGVARDAVFATCRASFLTHRPAP